LGDRTNIPSIEEYDPAENRWRDIGILKEARHGFAAVYFDYRIYVFGGYGPNGRQTKTLEMLHLDGKSARRLDMPVPRGFHAAILDRDRIICFGGRPPGSHPSAYEMYSFSWSDLLVPDIDLNRFFACVLAGKIWTVGGESEHHVPILSSYSLAEWK
jgi:hypothetical protein